MARLQRARIQELPEHLARVHDIEVDRVDTLDLGVVRVCRRGGVSWVARVFPTERPLGQALGDAQILRFLEEHAYPAEPCAAPDPVSTFNDQAVLVTAHMTGVPLARRREAIRAAGGFEALGSLLGRLQQLALADATRRAGGAWHHLADGAPANEIAALAKLLESTERPTTRNDAAAYDALRQMVAGLDDGTELPEALVHPDFVLANVIAPPTGGLVLVDWTGAGQAARIWPLSFLLWSAGTAENLTRVERTIAGYRRHISLEPVELERLETLMHVRPFVLDTWAACVGQKSFAQATASIAAGRETASVIARRARNLLRN